MHKQGVRLSKDIVPNKYSIVLKIDFQQEVFLGEELIFLDIIKPTNTFTLHSVDINITQVKIIQGKRINPTVKIAYNKNLEQVCFITKQKYVGCITISMQFSGKILKGLRGLYFSDHYYKKNLHKIVLTQFEATDARRVFPCFDEPNKKATFDVSLIVPKQMTALSNTIESHIIEHNADYKLVKFIPSPKMSTYLLAFIVGEFENIEAVSDSNILIRVFTPPGKIKQATFALDVAKRTVEYLEKYFAIKYPLPTLDLIAIPDFSAGAMENWGAITFRETALLVDESQTSFIGRQRVAEVIAHEIVHQWFGNLVTMEWWTHLWLNESFATYMAYMVVDELFPQWHYFSKFVLQELSTALKEDALHTTHPIEVAVSHPHEISEIFDGISYSKGASVLRMLSAYIGPQAFRNGLRLYLKKHSYQNTSSIHLWEAFAQASGKPVGAFMKAWTTKSSYPVISISKKQAQIIIKQQQFNYLPNHSKQLWQIPLLPVDRKNLPLPAWLLSNKKQVFSGKYHPIKFNHLEQSFFISKYDNNFTDELLQILTSSNLSNMDRLAIVRNYHLLTKAGLTKSSEFLHTITLLQNEQSYLVWSSAISGLMELESVFFNTPIYNSLQKWKKDLFGKIIEIKELGYTKLHKETQNKSLLRGIIFLQAGLSGHALTITHAIEFFKLNITKKIIDPDLRSAIYSIALIYGGQKVYGELLNIYHKSKVAQEKIQALQAITFSRNKIIQKQFLKYIFTEKVRDQDRFLVLHMALQQPFFKDLAWQAVIQNWATLAKKFTGTKVLDRIIAGATSFNSKSELIQFNKFIKKYRPVGVKKAIAQTTEQVLINIAWQNRDMTDLRQYFVKKRLPKSL